jgi:hypothetical protein
MNATPENHQVIHKRDKLGRLLFEIWLLQVMPKDLNYLLPDWV